MKRRQAPRISAAVPVHTPLEKICQHCIVWNVGYHLHEPLQRGELDSLYTLSQPSHLLLNSRFRLLYTHFLAIGFFPDTTLLKIQIQSH